MSYYDTMITSGWGWALLTAAGVTLLLAVMAILVGEVLRVIRNLAQEGRSMLVVTHEMNFAREVSSRTIFLQQGMIEEDGVPSEIFLKPRSERFRQFLSNHLKN
jgi:ABC-type histidine transport system ATPase subunit